MEYLEYESPISNFVVPNRNLQFTHLYFEVSPEYQDQDFLLVFTINAFNGDNHFPMSVRANRLTPIDFLPKFTGSRINPLRSIRLIHPAFPNKELLAVNHILSGSSVDAKLRIFYF